MKEIGYLIFAFFYYFFRLFFSIKPKKVFGIMTHDSSRDGNVGAMIEYLKKRNEGYTFYTLKNKERKFTRDASRRIGKIAFFIEKPYHLATSQFILLDNVFLPMAYLKFPKRVKVIQLWHGTGTIKRFGQDVNTGRLKQLEKRANECTTHLIVNSTASKEQYAKAFGVSPERVFVYGLPRTDLFFDHSRMSERKQKFYKEYPELSGKKLVLYAPTFRDQEKDHPRLMLDTLKLGKEMPEDYVFLLRLHPFVADAYKREELHNKEKQDNLISMSEFKDLNTLLLVADYLITDYSSIIFEYSLLEKPMIFYAYDLEQFSDYGRGFYFDYEEYIPGPVISNTEDLITLLKNNQFNLEKIREFRNKNYGYLDGKSAERLYLHIFREDSNK